MSTASLVGILPADLAVNFDLERCTLGDRPATERRLSDLRGAFHDAGAFDAALAKDDPLVYRVVSVEPASGDGQLHYGLGLLMPGKIGDEYFITKGHFHEWRPAAEVYIGLRGEGCMILENGDSGCTEVVPLGAGKLVYVPGNTAHRTANTGGEPLVYFGVYPSSAGHDYASIATRNFRCCLVERDGQPQLVERKTQDS
jgi:glucose-6-phosphate isomerase